MRIAKTNTLKSSIDLQILKYLLLYLDRKDLTHLQLSCHFFKIMINIEVKLYQQAQAPALDYGFFCGKEPKKNHILSLTYPQNNHFRSPEIAPGIQLQNGLLVSPAYANQESQVYLWQIETKKKLAELITSRGKITALLEVADNVLAVGLDKGYIEFYDLQNPQKPSKIAETQVVRSVANKATIQLTLCCPGVLALIAENDNCNPELQLLHFNSQNASIKILPVATLPKMADRSLFALDEYTVLIVTNFAIFVYDLTEKNKGSPIKSIKFAAEKQYPRVIKLNDNKLLAVYTYRNKFTLDVWDVSPQTIQLLKSVLLPTPCYSRCYAQLFQKRNNELLIIAPDNYDSGRLLVVDLKKEPNKELLKEIPFKLKGLFGSQFIEDGRYLLTSSYRKIDCIRIPLLKKENLTSKSDTTPSGVGSFKTQLSSCQIS